MTKQMIVKYVLESPENVNAAILYQMLDELTEGSIVPTGRIRLTQLGVFDVKTYAEAEVALDEDVIYDGGGV